MPEPVQPLKSDLQALWLLQGLLLTSLLMTTIFCLQSAEQIQTIMAEEQRELTRSLLYVIAMFVD